ncbi:hypothetical protein POM88_001110 [Heracleum sosnowskyi]|uniref:Secreted protein n=1 Tax=Heracleum sosnowskyi TaxID=360622 RepID=A0AAD8N4P4_9APIA|nr:hypothetical protein POM88_001110 [Heracleum sosnowskyi]
MGMWRRVGMILVVWLSGFGRMFAGAGGALSQPSADAPTLDSPEQVYISSLALLKMLKHANALVMNDDCQTPVDVARVNRWGNVVRTIEGHICLFSSWLCGYAPKSHICVE